MEDKKIKFEKLTCILPYIMYVGHKSNLSSFKSVLFALWSACMMSGTTRLGQAENLRIDRTIDYLLDIDGYRIGSFGITKDIRFVL